MKFCERLRTELRNPRFYIEILALVVVAIYTSFTYLNWTTAIDQLQTSERPYVSIGQADGTLAKFSPSSDGKAAIALFFTNAGHSPALNFLVNAGLAGLPPRFGKGSIEERHLERFQSLGSPTMPFHGILSSASGTDIPGQSTHREYLVSKWTLTSEEVKGIKTGKYPFFEVFGDFEFCDQFGEYRCREFSLRYVPSPVDAFVSGPLPVRDCFLMPSVPPPEPVPMKVLHRCEQPGERKITSGYADRNAGVVFPAASNQRQQQLHSRVASKVRSLRSRTYYSRLRGLGMASPEGPKGGPLVRTTDAEWPQDAGAVGLMTILSPQHLRDVSSPGFLLPHSRLRSLSDSYNATAVTAPSRPTTAEAAAGFVPREALAGYRSPQRGLVLLPLRGFSPTRLSGVCGNDRLAAARLCRKCAACLP